MERGRTGTLALVLGAALLAGCASSNEAAGQASTSAVTAADQAGRKATCPMLVPGTRVTAQDVEGGVALSFATNNAADVAELRARVRRMAQMHEQRSAGQGTRCPCPAGPQRGPGAQGGSGGMGMMMQPMPAANAAVEDTDDGARLVLRPEDPAQLQPLRERVASHAARMSQGECPMTMMGMGGSQAPAQQGEDPAGHHQP